MYKRKHASILESRLKKPRKLIQIIAGPPQTGKTTMVKQVLVETMKRYLFVTVDEKSNKHASWIHDVWQQARQIMEFDNCPEYILAIDDIHKIDNWSEVVKMEWEADTAHGLNLKVVLLGSSRMLLKDGLTESLAGGYELIEMDYWSYAEMRDAFKFHVREYIYYGGYPGAAPYTHNQFRWSQYMTENVMKPAIFEDVLMTKRVLKPQVMYDLFIRGCSHSGEMLSFHKIKEQIKSAGNSSTLANYLQVLEESHLVAAIQQYASEDERKYKSIPKLQVFSSGMLNAMSMKNIFEIYSNLKEWERRVETAIGGYLLSNANKYKYKVYYWRQGNEEVDFVLKHSRHLVAIEIKKSRLKQNSGLTAFREQFHPDVELLIDGEIMTIEQFLLLDLKKLFGSVVSTKKVTKTHKTL